MAGCYQSLLKKIKKKGTLLAILIDPDKLNMDVVRSANELADLFLVGGSTLKPGEINKAIRKIKKHTTIPLIIFPGDYHQVDKQADAILFLSLISGRDPEYLIGKQVASAHVIKTAGLEAIPTGYILVDGSAESATQRVTGSKPIAAKDTRQVVHTAIAGEMLGMKMIYLEAGSGAKASISPGLIKKVKAAVSIPVLAGGGINSYAKAKQVKEAGADIIVIGNALEKNIHLLEELTELF
ncbi:MAG: geranylgeranylglyceryl/heptaprenylglyceryl phosphate synthase [Bacteroidetes bacterium]|jgi:putative glycerol-1-phosphate prenyltransferase|nr:geranylgeranylglyceryl/heptaprenylglyceryl phosphate synthase [Bacteroidota bacterium]